MDILQPLPLEKWTSLREMTKENWPIYAHVRVHRVKKLITFVQNLKKNI